MRILALFLPIPVLGLLRRDLQHEWAVMSEDQVATLARAYKAGLAYGLAESMRAICWQESSAGLDLENKEDGTEGSYGYFGANPVIVATRVYGTWPSRPSDQQITLIKFGLKSFDYGVIHCTKELEYWINQYLPGEWSKVWASYNAGHEVANGKGYARDIKEKIMFLRRLGVG